MLCVKFMIKASIQGIYAIADPAYAPAGDPVGFARRCLEGGAQVLQLRVKFQDKSRILDWAHQIVAMKKKFPFTFIVNDSVDVALEVGADGVHVGEGDLPIPEVRQCLGEKMLIGYSSHALGEAMAAAKSGADYVAFGAIFPTKTKGPGHPVQGLEKLRAVVQGVKVPVVAIGGITRKNFDSVRETGVAAIAMITGLTEAKDVTHEVRSYCRRF